MAISLPSQATGNVANYQLVLSAENGSQECTESYKHCISSQKGTSGWDVGKKAKFEHYNKVTYYSAIRKNNNSDSPCTHVPVELLVCIALQYVL